MTNLLDLSGAQAVTRMVQGELRAEHYAAALLARCAERADLNAFITLRPERVLQAAREADQRRDRGERLGPLHGLPIPVKDSLNTHDYPTTAGTAALRHFQPTRDAPLMGTLRAAGAIVLGKTNLHELSFGWTSNNRVFGAVRNPFVTDRIAGGSSGGTAAAVAARMAPLGVAEDTEGSIRVPAALCGIAGFRPTTGRYSSAGAVPISARFDQTGPHARSVDDLVLFDSVAARSHQPILPVHLDTVRLGVCRRYFHERLSDDVAKVVAAAEQRLQDAGVVFVDVPLPGLGALIARITAAVQNHDVRHDLANYLERYGVGLGLAEVIAQASPDIRATFARDVLPGGPGFCDDEQYATIVSRWLPELQALYRHAFAAARVDALWLPATQVTAPRIGDEADTWIDGQRRPFTDVLSRNIAPASTVGLPGLVLPAGVDAAGLPVSIELDGPAGTDARILALGRAIEQALPRPPRAPN